MLALAPELMDLESATDEPSLPGLARIAAHPLGSAFVAYGDFRKYCGSGSWGKVRGTATAEKGSRWLGKAVAASADFLTEWKASRSKG
jgi:creatinine amidohydrolase/Fe(II)-dependent formamide hydrolase-like protein